MKLTDWAEAITNIINAQAPGNFSVDNVQAYPAVDPWKCFMNDDELHVWVLPADVVQGMDTNLANKRANPKWLRTPQIAILLTKKLVKVETSGRDTAPWSEFKPLVDLTEELLEAVYVNLPCIRDAEVQLAIDLPLEIRHYASAVYIEVEDPQCLDQKYLLGPATSSTASSQDQSEPPGMVSTVSSVLFSGIALGASVVGQGLLLLAALLTTTQSHPAVSKPFVSSWKRIME